VCGEREHAAELAAAEHAEHGVGENHGQNLKLINRMGRMNKINLACAVSSRPSCKLIFECHFFQRVVAKRF
jgi:hypothetical protein